MSGADDGRRPEDGRRLDPARSGGPGGRVGELLEFARSELGAQLIRTYSGGPYVLMKGGPTRAALDVTGSKFAAVVGREYARRCGSMPSPQVVRQVVDYLRADALLDGQASPVYVRTASHGDSIYIDLGRDDVGFVRVDRDAWVLVEDSPVPFVRPEGFEPLPVPRQGGDIAVLRGLLNIEDGEWPLVVAFLLGALAPEGPYPLLEIVAEQGAGKSTQARMLRALVDPNTAPLRSLPSSERDLMIAATNARLLAFDNLSGLSSQQSDALCRLATGAGFATRKLYSDADEVIFDQTRPVILTGIDQVVSRPDLLERSILLSLRRIDPAERRTERDLWREFDRCSPLILGALLTAASVALDRLTTVEHAVMPRMADFATWVTAGEGALGLEAGEFIAAYEANQQRRHADAVEGSTVGQALVRLADSKGVWTGTTRELQAALTRYAPSEAARGDVRRCTPASMGKLLRRLAPNLRRVGVSVEHLPRTSSERLIEIRRHGGGDSGPGR